MFQFTLDKKLSKSQLQEFADGLEELSQRIGFKISPRGWCYQLESERVINKDQFDKVENYINKCRKEGLLPVDFVAEEESRQFSGVSKQTPETLQEFIRAYIEAPLSCYEWYEPDWWANEEYYIQMLVEKIDLKTLFSPVCEEYHIPIATSKGWSSVLQRATYALRFKEAEERGLKCVLLYAGDHDPDGLRISDFIKKNLYDIQDVCWEGGSTGYDPTNLIIDRFGLSSSYINANNLTWIDNLITGSGNNLALPSHKNHSMPYVKEYIRTYGVRKCEANAIVPFPVEARQLVREAIEKYLSNNALARFSLIRENLREKAYKIYDETGLRKTIDKTLIYLDSYNDDEN